MKLFLFNVQGETTGSAADGDLLGGKGANLAEMASLGLPVPPGMTVTTETCNAYLALKDEYRYSFLKELVTDHVLPVVARIEDQFGYQPLFSVRSGARVSMPGMMDTVLNVGINNTSLPEWGDRLGNRAALDSFRRGIQMTGTTACDHPAGIYEGTLTRFRADAKVKTDADLSADQLSYLVSDFLNIYEKIEGGAYPLELSEHLILCIDAVFRSWNTERAIYYRKMHNYPDTWGTAVNIQAMVFGNMNDDSCSGVLFTRDPSTGEDKLTGEYLVNAQGEDVVAGIRTPENLTKLVDWNASVTTELGVLCENLETHYKDMQDIEFTVQDGELFMLQTRNAKRAAAAKFRVAHDLREEGLITTKEMRSRLTGADYDALTSVQIDPTYSGEHTYTGLGAGGSFLCGIVATTSASAIALAESTDVILVRKETTPDDIAGMDASDGILTTTGGATSHAAVVARGMNKVCVVGCSDLNLDTLNDGDLITIDGATGRVWLEEVPLVQGKMDQYARAILKECMEEDEPLVVVGTEWEDNNGVLVFPLNDFDAMVEAKAAMQKILDDGGELKKVILDMTPAAEAWDDADYQLLKMTAGTATMEVSRQFSRLFAMAEILAEDFNHGFYAVTRGEHVTTINSERVTRISHEGMVFGRKQQLAHLYFGG